MISAPAGPAAALRAWFDRPAIAVARDLLGARVLHVAPEGTVGGRIVEVEAYAGPEDLAAHSARGRTPRNEVMFGPPGRLYVYLVYGLHHCMNVVTGPGDKPEAVLIRALEIDEGIELARRRRGPRPRDSRLAAGPGNVGQALGVDRSLNGTDLTAGPVRVVRHSGPTPAIRRGPRVGVNYAGPWADRAMRFWIADDPHRSRG